MAPDTVVADVDPVTQHLLGPVERLCLVCHLQVVRHQFFLRRKVPSVGMCELILGCLDVLDH